MAHQGVNRPGAEVRRRDAGDRHPVAGDRHPVAAGRHRASRVLRPDGEVRHRDAKDHRGENHHHQDEEHWDDWACRNGETITLGSFPPADNLKSARPHSVRKLPSTERPSLFNSRTS